MQASTVKKTFLAIMLASILPLAACGDDNDTPTSPTQSGPPVSTPAPAPAPAPTPTPTPAPTPTPPPPPGTTVTESGMVFNPFTRSGPGDINVTFRLSDTTVVHADANTVVRAGSVDSNTTALLLGQAVTVTGVQQNGFVQATRIVITSQ